MSEDFEGADDADEEPPARPARENRPQGPLQRQKTSTIKPQNRFQTHIKKEEEPYVHEKKPAVPRAPWRLKKEDKEKLLASGTTGTKKKNNNKILASMPANWEEEEKKFFDAGFAYDPQFEYDCPATNKRFLKMFPAPKFDLLPQALKIMDTYLERHGSESKYQEAGGRKLTEK